MPTINACQPKILSLSLNLRERVLFRLFSWSRIVLWSHISREKLAPTSTKAQYDLKDAKAFAQFLHDADVRLVRSRCKSYCCYGYVGYVVRAEGSGLLSQVTCPKSKRIASGTSLSWSVPDAHYHVAKNSSLRHLFLLTPRLKQPW